MVWKALLAKPNSDICISGFCSVAGIKARRKVQKNKNMKRKPNPKYLNYTAILAISLLITLMFFVSVNDISRVLLFWN